MNVFKTEVETLEYVLQSLENEQDNIFERAEMAIRHCKKTLEVVRQRVSQLGFKTLQEEAVFFKEIKSTIVGYLFYYISLVQVERARPYGCPKKERKFLIAQIKAMQAYLMKHQELYEYFLRSHDYRDQDYFIRKNTPYQLSYEAIASMVDFQFATPHDMIFSKIKGYVLSINHLEKRLAIPPTSIANKSNAKLQWTGSKADLVELTYALHASGLVNNGTAAIKDLAQGMEQLFAIKLGDYYRIFLEIRARKNNQAKLLEMLRHSLISKIENLDH
ncbi:MAG: RteC domain-containing protein [Gelidibacter sp.]